MGINRFADIAVFYNDKPIMFIQVGKMTKGLKPVAREAIFWLQYLVLRRKLYMQFGLIMDKEDIKLFLDFVVENKYIMIAEYHKKLLTVDDAMGLFKGDDFSDIFIAKNLDRIVNIITDEGNVRISKVNSCAIEFWMPRNYKEEQTICGESNGNGVSAGRLYLNSYTSSGLKPDFLLLKKFFKHYKKFDSYFRISPNLLEKYNDGEVKLYYSGKELTRD